MHYYNSIIDVDILHDDFVLRIIFSFENEKLCNKFNEKILTYNYKSDNFSKRCVYCSKSDNEKASIFFNNISDAISYLENFLEDLSNEDLSKIESYEILQKRYKMFFYYINNEYDDDN